MGGIGKTTLASSIFSEISDKFDGSSFLANIRDFPTSRGLVRLQKQLIFEILGERNINICDVHIGSIEIMRRLRHKSVLVILDDVDQLEQLQALAGMHDWFGLGSRIVITTRNRHLLVSHGVDYVHMVNGLNDGEALKLFCWKAFRNCLPTPDYFGLSLQMVDYAGGLPLALNVLGSFLFGRSKAKWKDA
ncbi:putative disease resistance protein At4g11170 [Pistacia vera]|uniref:putative disease resistance protein At4g11170 n=1 Tax=Pistacia vera TaxID=55513 RepID=UPI001263AEBF|nr:putative disease resistance protein At4g11170 [Pistacia vera]